MPANILIIDDEEALRKLLTRIVRLEGFMVEEAADLKSGLHMLQRKQIDVVLCDVKLPDGNGVGFVSSVKKHSPLSECILLTAYGNIADGVQAIKNGAFDYITKGNDNDRIIPLLYQAIDKVAANRRSALDVCEKSKYEFSSVIGESPVVKQVMALAQKVAPTDINVLLLGETGTGKEVFASAIHAASKRSEKTFIAINCSAFSKEMLEGELFGHKQGAFTGAVKDKKGIIQLADKGTLFLDEIGEMDISLQAKLLRVIENGEFIRLGDEKSTRVDVRIIAATNRDLTKEIHESRFREDLFYRINGFTISLPPLRERPGDISLLSAHFLQKYAVKNHVHSITLHADTLKLLQQQPWKGNIRELKNVLERAAVLSDSGLVLPEHLPYEIQKQQPTAQANLSLAAVEKAHITRILELTKGNKSRSAELLGIGLTTLYRKIEEYGI